VAAGRKNTGLKTGGGFQACIFSAREKPECPARVREIAGIRLRA